MNWKDTIKKQRSSDLVSLDIAASQGQTLINSMKSLSQIGIDAKVVGKLGTLMKTDTDKVVSLLEAHSNAIQEFTSALKKMPKSVPSISGANTPIMPNQAEGTPIAQKNS